MDRIALKKERLATSKKYVIRSGLAVLRIEL